MVYNLEATKKVIRSHIYDRMFKAYKVFGYDPEKDALYPGFYPPARDIVVKPGWHVSDRVFGNPNTVWDNDVPIKLNKRKYLRVDKGIHFALTKEALRLFPVFQHHIMMPIYVSPLDIVSVEKMGEYVVAMKIFVEERDHQRALFRGKRIIEKFRRNIKRTRMR